MLGAPFEVQRGYWALFGISAVLLLYKRSDTALFAFLGGTVMARISVEHVPAALEGFEIQLTVNTSPNGGYSITGIGLNQKGRHVAKSKRVQQVRYKSMIPAKKR